MSGAEQIYKSLQNMDIQRLTKILSEAKTWIEQNYEQARDQLLDSPQLAYALYNIPDILEQKYQDLELGVDSFGNQRYQNSQSTLYPNQYRNSQMQGVFLDFQSNNDNNTNEQQEQEPIHHQQPQPIPPPQSIPPSQPMQMPVQQSYDSLPQAQPQNMYYPPQSNMYDQVYQQPQQIPPPQYQYPAYGEPPPMQYQGQPQMSYSYGPVTTQEYAPTYEGAQETDMDELRKIAIGLPEDVINTLDKETRDQVIRLRAEHFANQQQQQMQQQQQQQQPEQH